MITALLLAGLAHAQFEVEEHTLDNGMKFLLLPRSDSPNEVALGWTAHVGSVNERPGITGISHFFEHMMFKGTNTIGTTDAEKDAEYREEQERVMTQLRALHHGQQYERFRLGEIDDPWDPFDDTDDMKALRAELQDLEDAQRKTTAPNEFDAIYRDAGAVGLNAFTTADYTFYHLGLPSNRIELWCWMESDRLHDAVFREFYAERSVVHEERRQRTESSPTGLLDEQVESVFWSSSPYGWPTIGWPSDLNSYTLEDAEAYFDTYYAPNNLTGILVGDFDAEAVKPQLEKYFGTLARRPAPPPVVTLEVEQLAERRLEGECDCSDQVTIRYHTPPFGHPDDFALSTLGDLLNGRGGRLHRSLVDDQKVASSALGFQRSRLLAGDFVFRATVSGDVKPEALEAAWYAELERLRNEPVGERELQRVKNGIRADLWRSLTTNEEILEQLASADHLGSWRWIFDEPEAMAAVTPEDIQRVVNTWFKPENRTVAIYRRSASSTEDPAFTEATAGLPANMKSMLKGQLAELDGVDDAEGLALTIADMESQVDQMPPDLVPAIEYLVERARERLAELQEGQ